MIIVRLVLSLQECGKNVRRQVGRTRCMHMLFLCCGDRPFSGGRAVLRSVRPQRRRRRTRSMRLWPEYHASSSAYRGWSAGGGVYGFAAAVFCASARPAKPRRALVEHLVRKENRQRAESFLQRRPRASRPPVRTSGISGRQCDNRPTRPLPAGMRQKRPPSGRTDPLYAVASPCVCGTSGHSSVPLPHKA